MATRALAGPLLSVLIILTGCDPSLPPPKAGPNWTVPGIGGPVEVRPLPPASKIVEDFNAWLNSQSDSRARVYEGRVWGETNQQNFSVQILRGGAPLGPAVSTRVSFIYNDPTNGSYEFRWGRLGRHNTSFLQLGQTPKRVWLYLDTIASAEGVPKLDIVAFEGIELGGGVGAEPGKRP